MSINGAGRHDGFCNAMESGVILELLLRNKKVNPQYSFHVMESVTWEMVQEQERLDLYLNTHITQATTKQDTITGVIGVQISTNTEFHFTATAFIDTTGDGNLGYMAGADWTIGREGKEVYDESLAPDVSDEHTMGSTILYQAKHMGKPMPFQRPSWAYPITEEMLGARNIHEVEDGYWWVEVGGDDLKIIEDAEEIRDELLKYAYGAFDYVKNSGKFPQAEDLVLDWVAPIPGKRESRRLYGDYVLHQRDCTSGTRFSDAVAYGGWTMDDHTSGGIRGTLQKNNKKDEGTMWHPIEDIYTIPYRSLYSRNIRNLWMGGRCISASHMALSSTRVIATCAVIGQAIGTAAALATKYQISARGVGEHMEELQQTLIRDDAYLPNIPKNDPLDVCTSCEVVTSSAQEGGEGEGVLSPYGRRIGTEEHTWISKPMSPEGEWIALKFPKSQEISKVTLRFDPNFSRLLTPTIALCHQAYMVEGMPHELVREYVLLLEHEGREVGRRVVEENILRVNCHTWETPLLCDRITLHVKATYGDPHARVMQVSGYARTDV